MNRKKPTKGGDMPGQPSWHIEMDQCPLDVILMTDDGKDFPSQSIITLLDPYSRAISDCLLIATEKPGLSKGRLLAAINKPAYKKP